MPRRASLEGIHLYFSQKLPKTPSVRIASPLLQTPSSASCPPVVMIPDQKPRSGMTIYSNCYEQNIYVMGESVRRNITDGVPGVPLHLDIQRIDVHTCEPIKDAFLEICTKSSPFSSVHSRKRGNCAGALLMMRVVPLLLCTAELTTFQMDPGCETSRT